MTMLDRMRRHKGWLKWSLALVVLAFVLLYVPDFIGGGQPSSGGTYSMTDTIARVEDRTITAGEFRRTYLNQVQIYQNAYGGQMNEQLLKQLGIDQRILQQMIDEEVALAEAERLNIGATDAELRQRIVTMPAFQENGKFIGEQRYRQVLRMQRPPLRHEEFEEQLRRSLVIQKLRAALTDWMKVTDVEIDEEFRNRNEKVKLEFVVFAPDRFRDGLTATDAEIQAHFDQNKERFRIPAKRKVKYLLIDLQALRGRITILPQDVRRYYDDNVEQFSTPDQVKASHVLIKVDEGTTDDAARKRAEEVLTKAKAGADFAELAKQHSQDESNAKTGGDLGFFGRGAMVPEFEEAAFGLQPGQISDVVKTQFGYHVIKVTEKKAGETRPFEQVRPQIEDQLKWERAQQQAQQTAEDLEDEIENPADLDRVGKARGLTVGESGFFTREEPIAGLGFAPEVGAAAFQLELNKVSDPIRTPSGIAYVAVTGEQQARVPGLAEVKDTVRDDLLKKKAVDAARARATSLAAAFKSDSFAAAAKTAGLEVKTTELIARGAPLPEVGTSEAVDTAVFALPAGGVTDPIATDNGVVIARVAERDEVTTQEIAQGRNALGDQILNERRNRFFSAYMSKAKQKMEIEINREVLRQIVA
ncbi:MAG TPA: peptidyl-prolyl cis-trans isomerase [Vicinamibacterales bacterium]|nr:peptidyl-prolyl cis-trans isomerase [Vicinamibacterales bacterium]